MRHVGITGPECAKEKYHFLHAQDMAKSASQVAPSIIEQGPTTPTFSASGLGHFHPDDQPIDLQQEKSTFTSPGFQLSARADSLPEQYSPQPMSITPAPGMHRASSTPSTCSNLIHLLQGCDISKL
jgi:hypothetical protein